ncbi:MAG: EamA family transporter [Allgaiera sp.]|jgi:drug/metabolite transporter (DMT)-like permease|nr:EamA family transporter [Allgaiera sp.]
MTAADVAKAIGIALIWGMGFVVAKAGTETFPPILLQALRFVVTSVALVWFLPRPAGNMRWLLIATFVGATVQYALTFTGLTGLSAGVAALVVQTEVPFLVLLGALVMGERPTRRKWVGIGIAFAGVAVITGIGHLQGSLGSILLVLGGAFTWAMGQVLVRKIRGLNGLAVTGWIAVLAVPQLFVASFLFESGQRAAIVSAGPSVWFAVLYLGLVMQALGYAWWNSLLIRHEVGQVAPFLLLLPIFAVLGGVVFLGEALVPSRLIGGAIILAGVALISTDKGRALPAPVAVEPA